MVATPADEPLWAIEEDGLSYVYSIDFKEGYNKDDASKIHSLLYQKLMV